MTDHLQTIENRSRPFGAPGRQDRGRDLAAHFAVIAGIAETDPAAALARLHRAVADQVFAELGRPGVGRGWSRPVLKADGIDAERAITGRLSDSKLVIQGRQPFYAMALEAAAVLVRDADGSKGGYVVEIDLGAYLQPGEPIFGRPGFHVDALEIARPVAVETYEPVAPQPWQDALRISALAGEYLHTALDYGVIRGFAAAAHLHLTTRTRPWQGQSLARATDDPHLVRRYGEYVATRHGLEGLVAEATDAVASAFGQDPPGTLRAAEESVATARGFALLAGRSIISGTIELLGASATSQRYGFDVFWRDFTAHAVAHPPLWPAETIGGALLAPDTGKIA